MGTMQGLPQGMAAYFSPLYHFTPPWVLQGSCSHLMSFWVLNKAMYTAMHTHTQTHAYTYTPMHTHIATHIPLIRLFIQAFRAHLLCASYLRGSTACPCQANGQRWVPPNLVSASAADLVMVGFVEEAAQ